MSGPAPSVDVEDFRGVYLLYCTNPKYKGRTYIGFTVDPNRRIKQHNKGRKAGGACRTSNKGPWEMVLIVHGFPNEISALRFEWAWQHPHRSRRLQHVAKKRTSETRFKFCFRVLTEMLRVGPWFQMPLTIRWLKPEYALEFPVNMQPPIHMPIAQGTVKRKKILPAAGGHGDISFICGLCHLSINPEEKIECIQPTCNFKSHIICLAKQFVKNTSYLIPVLGNCPTCMAEMLWGDLIMKKKGGYRELDVENGRMDTDWTEGLVIS